MQNREITSLLSHWSLTRFTWFVLRSVVAAAIRMFVFALMLPVGIVCAIVGLCTGMFDRNMHPVVRGLYGNH